MTAALVLLFVSAPSLVGAWFDGRVLVAQHGDRKPDRARIDRHLTPAVGGESNRPVQPDGAGGGSVGVLFAVAAKMDDDVMSTVRFRCCGSVSSWRRFRSR